MTLASTLDRIRRTPDEVSVWQLALAKAGVEYPAAQQALLAHFADPEVGTEFLKPAHIVRQIALAAPSIPLPPHAGEGICPIHDAYPVDAAGGGCWACRRYPADVEAFALTGRKPALVNLTTGQLAAGRAIPSEV